MYLPEINVSVKIKDAEGATRHRIRSSRDLHALALEIFDADKIQWTEEVIILSLSAANDVLGYYKVSAGGTASAIVDIKVIATVALQTLAQKIVLMHNHPSGNLTPSTSDDLTTEKLAKGIALLEIKLLDHLIVTPTGYYSYIDEGKL